MIRRTQSCLHDDDGDEGHGVGLRMSGSFGGWRTVPVAQYNGFFTSGELPEKEVLANDSKGCHASVLAAASRRGLLREISADRLHFLVKVVVREATVSRVADLAE